MHRSTDNNKNRIAVLGASTLEGTRVRAAAGLTGPPLEAVCEAAVLPVP